MLNAVRSGFFCLFLSLLTATAIASGQEMDLPCETCHSDIEVSSPPHQIFDCMTCHSNVVGMPHQDDPLAELSGIALCSQCHGDVERDLDAGVHAGFVECASCHGSAHQILPTSDLQSPASLLRQIETCAQCHDSDGVIDGYRESAHGRGLLTRGLIHSATCTSCHGSHRILATGDPHALISSQNSPDTCGACHQILVDSWRRSSHGMAWAEDGRGPDCTACHASHAAEPRTAPGARLKTPQNCGGCHGDRYESFRDSFHGQVTSLGFVTAAICSDCHTAHQNLPASDPASSVHPDNLAETCGRCHAAEINPAFLTYDPHLDAKDPESGAVYYIWLFMTLLIIGVFSFWGVHDLLWLQRSVVAFNKGEYAEARRSDGPFIRRFNRKDVWLHATVASSFLLLAATGLPIKFHYTDWAPVLASMLGGIETTRLLHRLAAIVTFGYFSFHLFDLSRKLFLRRDFGILWGWRSMAPQAQDFRDLFQNLGYFLYLRQKPRMDRWNYWEKFDYFAVFWGVAIIGVSGVFLWFPGFFTRLFPGWTLNAAQIIHSDEALLAVGFIFIFHFFHTHVRPESFPLDTTIFTGLVPLQRFKEERPLEYERLVQSGKLEQRLEEAPPRSAVVKAYVFGGLALAIGLLLAAAVFIGLVFY